MLKPCHSQTYDNFFFTGDFNVGIDKNFMKTFCDINCPKSLVKEPTFQNPDKPIHKPGQSIPTQQYF